MAGPSPGVEWAFVQLRHAGRSGSLRCRANACRGKVMRLLDFPLVFFLLSFATLCLAGWVGTRLRRLPRIAGTEREDYSVLLAATLTLLGLIIGFSFSMAVSRYDQRKNLEEEEANAIGTEYLRADLLSMPADPARTHSVLVAYLDQRILFYVTRNSGRLQQVALRTAQLQTDLWSSVRSAPPNPFSALAVAGMNDVINSQGYTQAAWLNRIPVMAWVLMEVIAILSSAFVGFGAVASKPHPLMFFVLPLVVSISFFLIADIDSPRGGIVKVHPQNLISLSASLRAEPP
jgi:hypothetical protein